MGVKKEEGSAPRHPLKRLRGEYSFVAGPGKGFTRPAGRGNIGVSSSVTRPATSLLDQTKSKTEQSVGRPGSRKALGAYSFVRSLSGHFAEP